MKKLSSLFMALPLVAILMFSPNVFADTGDIVVERKPVTGKIEVGGGTLELPNSDTLPGTCVVGDTYVLTSAASGVQYHVCESTNVWTPQGSFYGAAYFPDYNEADQGATGNSKSAKVYIDTISTDSATLVFRHNSGEATTTYQLSTDETIPSNIELITEKGAILNNDLSIRNATYKWTASGSGTDEYYLELAAGGDPGISELSECAEDDSKMTEDTAGSLAVGEWDWADNDVLGYSTVYVRLSDGADPDGKAADFVEAGYTLTINGPFDAGLYQVFSGDGNVNFGALAEVFPEWCGIDGVDDAIAFNKAISMLPTNGGTLLLQEGTYITATPIVITNKTYIIGKGQASTLITNSAATDMFEWEGSYSGVSDLRLISDNGHVFQQTGSTSGCIFKNLFIFQQEVDKSVWENNNDGIYIQNTWESCYIQHKNTATVPLFNFIATTCAVNSNMWRDLEIVLNGDYGFYIESNRANNYVYSNCIKDILWEQPIGGCIKILGGNQNSIIRNKVYDLSSPSYIATNHLIHIGKGTGAGLTSTLRMVIEGFSYVGANTGLDAGIQHIYFETNGVSNAHLNNCSGHAENLLIDYGKNYAIETSCGRITRLNSQYAVLNNLYSRSLHTYIQEKTVNITAAASIDTTINISDGYKLLGVQFRIDEALAAGETWDAAYTGGAVTALATAEAVAAGTRVNTLHVEEIASGAVGIAITKNGGGAFTAQGKITTIVYYEMFLFLGSP